MDDPELEAIKAKRLAELQVCFLRFLTDFLWFELNAGWVFTKGYLEIRAS